MGLKRSEASHKPCLEKISLYFMEDHNTRSHEHNSFLPIILLLSLMGCGSSEPLPNVILITIDTLRSDHCSCYGYFRETTPRIDGIAAQGVRFDTAYAPMPTTGPTHATLFTSLYPLVHGVVKNGYVLDPSFTTLAEALKRRGYQTAAVVSSYAVNKKFGYAQGFDYYNDDFSDAKSSIQIKKWEGRSLEGQQFDRRADDTTDKAITWLEGYKDDAPFYLWVHYFDPHHPYDPPEPYQAYFTSEEPGGEEEGYDTRPYDREVRFADHELGRLLDYLDSRFPPETTLLIITSDHGEGLMDHDHLTHGRFVYEEAMRVPLILRWKGRIPAGEVFHDPVEIGDLFPTLCSLVNLPVNRKDLMGRDIADALLTRGALPKNRSFFFQRRFYKTKFYKGIRYKGLKFGLREEDWKIIVAEEEETLELYNLEQDPGELNNLASTRPDTFKALKARLDAIRESLEKRSLTLEQKISDEDEERFEALGYLK
jgi:arylsulfatase A-like enzyme